MLQRLQQCCEDNRIEYHWHPGHNLLEKKISTSLRYNNIANRLKRIMKDLCVSSDPEILATYVCTSYRMPIKLENSLFAYNYFFYCFNFSER